jgi:hypothetical protein
MDSPILGGLQQVFFAGLPSARVQDARAKENFRWAARWLGMILGCLGFAGRVISADRPEIVVTPQETAELLRNPGMGWETFHRASKDDPNLPPWLPSTVLYARWGWNELETQPGELNTAFLDKTLRDAHDSGQKLAFRVMCCSTNLGHPYFPAWLQDVGGKILVSDHRGVEPLLIPDLDDPIVLSRHLDFIRRLGARYDGNPDIDHVDLGSIGWWGEWHMTSSKTGKMPTMENRMKVVNAYLAAFKKTPLIIPLNAAECASYATNHGAGWRVDSMGDLGSFSLKWNHMRNMYPAWMAATKVQDVWQTAPIAFEPSNGVDEFVTKNWPLRWIFNYALACHGSYYNGKSRKLPDDAHFRSELERFLQRLGYRLVLKELKHPAEASAGSKLAVSMQWQNIGSAPCYQPYRVAYRLSRAGYQAIRVSPIAVNHWLPGSIEMFTPDFFNEPKDLPPGEVYEVADSIDLPGDIPPGEYVLSVGIVGVTTEQPIVRLGITGRSDAGWYPLSKLQIIR